MVIGTITKQILKKILKKTPKSTVLGPKRVQSGPKKKSKLKPRTTSGSRVQSGPKKKSRLKPRTTFRSRVQSGPKKKRKLGSNPGLKAALATAGVSSVVTPLMRDGKKSQAETSKPTLTNRRGSMPGPKKKRKQSLDPAVRYSKGFVRDSKGNVIRHKKLTPEQLKERRGNR
jgi:hypothetical protein